VVDVAVANEARKLARRANCRRVTETEPWRPGRPRSRGGPSLLSTESHEREQYITIQISADHHHDSRGKNCILSHKQDACIVVRLLAQDKSFDTKGALDIRIYYSLIRREVRMALCQRN
jgi:hypothetical protein